MVKRDAQADMMWPGLQQRIGYRFSNLELLNQALTHRSFAREGGVAEMADNERLEFIGDAVLAMTIGVLLYARFPAAPEGVLTQSRADLVNASRLAGMARDLGLDECLKIGRSLHKSGGGCSVNVLSDAFEALIGAIFLDGGYARVAQVVDVLFGELLNEVAHQPGREDFKTKLQETLQRLRQVRPEYQVVMNGPVHQCQYEVEVVWDGRAHGRGSGQTKKRAEQEAARQALECLAASGKSVDE